MPISNEHNHAIRRVAIYAGVSTDDQANRQTPIRTQLDVCRRVIGEQFGIEVSVREFVDEGHSGTLGLRKTPDQRSGFRPELTELCEAIAAGEIDVVVAQDRDRLARDEYLMLELVNEYLRKHGVRLFDSGGEVDIESPEGLFQSHILAAVAASSESNKKGYGSARLRTGMSLVGEAPRLCGR